MMPVRLFCRLALVLLVGACQAGCKRQGNQQSTPAAPNTQPPAEKMSISGNFESADCQAIIGWVWDARQPDVPLTVEITDGDIVVATIKADVDRKDLADANIGNGKHGFIYLVPDTLKDKKAHAISVRISGTTVAVPGGPKTINCP